MPLLKKTKFCVFSVCAVQKSSGIFFNCYQLQLIYRKFNWQAGKLKTVQWTHSTCGMNLDMMNSQTARDKNQCVFFYTNNLLKIRIGKFLKSKLAYLKPKKWKVLDATHGGILDLYKNNWQKKLKALYLHENLISS